MVLIGILKYIFVDLLNRNFKSTNAIGNTRGAPGYDVAYVILQTPNLTLIAV